MASAVEESALGTSAPAGRGQSVSQDWQGSWRVTVPRYPDFEKAGNEDHNA